MNNNDVVIEFLLNQLRQQLTNNPYKQQCEDLAHEVLSLKNQLRDTSALVAELQKGVDTPSIADPNVNTAAWKLYDALAAKGQINGAQFNILKVAFYDAMLTALGKDGDVDACKPAPLGARIYGDPAPRLTGFDASDGYINCSVDKPEQSGCCKNDTQECDHNWIIAPGMFIAEGHKDNVPGSQFCCECGKREWDDKE